MQRLGFHHVLLAESKHKRRPSHNPCHSEPGAKPGEEPASCSWSGRSCPLPLTLFLILN
jgi:hypothetical protein